MSSQQPQQQQESRVSPSQKRARSTRAQRRASLRAQQRADAQAHKLTQYEYSAQTGWPENFRPAVAVDKGPHTEFVSTPSKAIREDKAAAAALPAATSAPAPVSLDIDQLRKHALPSPAVGAGFAQQGVPIVQRSPGYASGYGYGVQQQYATGAAPVMAAGGIAGGYGGATFVTQTPTKYTNAAAPMASTSYLPPPGTHSEMILPLGEAAPELFGGNAAASTPHYAPANLEAAATSTTTPMAGSTMRYGGGAAAAVATPAMAVGGISASPYVAAGGAAAAALPPTPMSTTWDARTGATMLTPGGQHHVTHLPPSGTSQQMTLSLAEAAPELFGGDPLTSTPHYVD